MMPKATHTTSFALLPTVKKCSACGEPAKVFKGDVCSRCSEKGDDDVR